MKILHTKDLHLGQKFMAKCREDKHKPFLSWISKLIKKEKADVLITICNQIFKNSKIITICKSIFPSSTFSRNKS